jgi:hypothetical protein
MQGRGSVQHRGVQTRRVGRYREIDVHAVGRHIDDVDIHRTARGVETISIGEVEGEIQWEGVVCITGVEGDSSCT